MLKTYKYRLYPSPSQKRHLWQILACARHFDNMRVEERKWAWQLEERSVSKTVQLRNVKHYKKTLPQAQIVHSHILQVVAADCDKAFQAFFRRIKKGETPGYPRFKGRNRFHSFGFKEYGNGFRMAGRRLKVSGVGRIAVRGHRDIGGFVPCDIKTLRITHKAGRWYACFSVEMPEPSKLPKTEQMVGLDVGISALATTSDGDQIENPNYYRQAQAKLRILQRSLARKKRGSKNRRKALLLELLVRVQSQQEHVANQRRDYLHQLSTELVANYDLIALEDLRIRNMVRNKHLSKSILDSGCEPSVRSIFRQYLTYKAGSAGREVLLVDPAYTSKTCSRCGAIFEGLTLSDRWVECACGLSLDRDHNAAIHILYRALVVNRSDGSVQHNVEGGSSCVL